MAAIAYSTSRRAVLTGFCAALSPLPAVAACAGPTEVERAYLALMAAEARGLPPDDTAFAEDAALVSAVPVSLADVKLKAGHALRRAETGRTYWPMTALLRQIGAMA